MSAMLNTSSVAWQLIVTRDIVDTFGDSDGIHRLARVALSGFERIAAL
jgi:hypothetical protein